MFFKLNFRFIGGFLKKDMWCISVNLDGRWSQGGLWFLKLVESVSVIETAFSSSAARSRFLYAINLSDVLLDPLICGAHFCLCAHLRAMIGFVFRNVLWADSRGLIFFWLWVVWVAKDDVAQVVERGLLVFWAKMAAPRRVERFGLRLRSGIFERAGWFLFFRWGIPNG